MITIVGGTGRLGRLVAAQLVSHGHQVRVVARSRPAVPVPGTEFVAADVRRPETLPAALEHATVVVSAMHGFDPGSGESPAAVDRDGNTNLFVAGRRAGAHIVLMSVVGAAPGHPMELHRMKAAAEQALRTGQLDPDRPDWTIVRASAFAELWAEILMQLAGRNGVPKVFGSGTNRLNFVSVEDVTAAVTRAVLDPTLRGQAIDVGGDDLTMTQLAQHASGRAEVGHIPRVALRAVSLAMRPIRPAQARVATSALLMDQIDLTFDPGPARAAQPWLPTTKVTDALDAQRCAKLR